MKITEKRIKQIILEELQHLSEEEIDGQENSEQQPGEKTLPDVDAVMKIVIGKIDQPKEYLQLLQAICKYKPETMSDGVKAQLLKKIRDMINLLLK